MREGSISNQWRKDGAFLLSGIGTKGESFRKDKFDPTYHIVYQDKFQMNTIKNETIQILGKTDEQMLL